MAERIPQKRLLVRYDNARDLRIFINDPTREDDIQQHVMCSCRMSVNPQRNRGVVVVENLAERTRDDLSGIIQSKLEYLTTTSDSVLGSTGLNIFESEIQKQVTIETAGGYCEIDAGVDQEVGRMFEGSVSRIRSEKSGENWATVFEIADGQTTGTGAVASQQFYEGTQLVDVIKHVARSMALGTTSVTNASLLEALGPNTASLLGRGYTVFGNSNAVMKKLIGWSRAEWFIDRGELYIVRKGMPVDPSERPVVIEQDVRGGMRKTPVPIDERGIFVESDFRRDVRIGRLVETRHRQFSGLWRADVVEHRLDNREGDWMTRTILRKLPDVFERLANNTLGLAG